MDMLAVERWVDTAGLCPDTFFYITIFRDPIRRIESNCRYENIQPDHALLWLEKDTVNASCGTVEISEWESDKCTQLRSQCK